MKCQISIILISFLAILHTASNLQADIATREEAMHVADNWVQLVIRDAGSWGGSKTATIEDIQDFNRKDRHIGYFCNVKPKGFVIISLLKGLVPVKAYSETCDLDPESEEGMADVIKLKMDKILSGIENYIGPVTSIRAQNMADNLEVDYSPAWDALAQRKEIFLEQVTSDEIEMNYESGTSILRTSWHQGAPYNQFCPTGDTSCTDCCPADPSGPCLPHLPTLVGCVAIAGSQIMKHWSWPPYGKMDASYDWDGDDSCDGSTPGETLSVDLGEGNSYAWNLMANRYVWDSFNNEWEDENGNSLTQDNVDAVSDLCYEVGVVVEMDYGVCGSSADTYDLEDAFEDHYYYSTACSKVNRSDYNYPGGSMDWFELLKAQFNVNRPVAYRVKGHALVGDGWRVRTVGGTDSFEYHMNYGWDNGFNAWYILDHLYYPSGGSTDDEYILKNIYPIHSLGESLSGNYLQPSPPYYRYFDQDAKGDNANFLYGQNLQFLPNISVSCTSTSGGSIRFIGSASEDLLLFSRGDTLKGIRISDGEIRLYRYGSIKFY